RVPVRKGGLTCHMGLRSPPNEDQAVRPPAEASAISGFPPCFLRGMSSRRLLGAPPQPPPVVLQRPVRPACRPPATPSSAKGPYGDHHAP
ncbi:hypothetical protein F444_22757, partial [Phytophthora nicotianae P1976]